jgi:hypothetical protein
MPRMEELDELSENELSELSEFDERALRAQKCLYEGCMWLLCSAYVVFFSVLVFGRHSWFWRWVLG